MSKSERSRSLLFQIPFLLLLIGPLLIGFEARAQGGQEKGPPSLTEDSFGLLPLPSKDSITTKRMRIFFPKYTVKQKIGEQDGPDFTYYRIERDSVHLANIRMAQDEKTIQRVIVHSPAVTDAFGVEIGMSYTEIKKNRPAIDHSTDYHYNTYAYEEDSHLAYEISGEIPPNSEGIPVDRRNYEEEEIRDWTVERLVWRRSADGSK
jgi:hypothetical protein